MESILESRQQESHLSLCNQLAGLTCSKTDYILPKLRGKILKTKKMPVSPLRQYF